jgi:hypothetical protein
VSPEVVIYIPLWLDGTTNHPHQWMPTYGNTPFAAAAPCRACAVSTQCGEETPCSIWCASCHY